jgi:hypothetical protein
MKKTQKILWGSITLFLIGFILLFGQDLFTKYQADHQAGQFLKNVANEDFNKAFDQLYFYNGAYDEDVTIGKEIAKKSWVTRNEGMKKAGVYIKSYEGLSTRLNDGYPQGTVDLIMSENGKKRIYRDVNISFSKSDGKWKVAGLSTMQEREWESKLGGHVTE